MSRIPSDPPADSDEAHGAEGSAGVATEIAASSSAKTAFGADLSGLFESESGVDGPGDAKRSARLLHEVAHQQARAGRMREAAKTYTRSLTLDPSFQANAWALRRVFEAHGFWDNLVRLLDAQIRFAALPGAADRADLHVEKARLLEDRLGRDDDAATAYHAAIEVSPGHPAALVALLVLGLRRNRVGDVETALGGLFAGVTEPEVRARFAVELSRRQRGPVRDGPPAARVREAVDTLFRALSSGAAAGPLLAELDRLSLVVDKADLRARVLDAFDSFLSRVPPQSRDDVAAAAALYREKARGLLRRGARDAALAVLERALAVAPGNALVVADYVDVADEAGRPDAIAALLSRLPQSGATDSEERALLRRAEVAARGGAYGEAIEALDRLRSQSRFATLGTLTRACLLARLGDADGLARLLEGEAQALLDGAGEDHAPRREAAHLFVRAATLRYTLGDAQDGEALCRRALDAAHAAGATAEATEAEDGLLEGLARRSEWPELRARLEDRLQALGPDMHALRERLAACLAALAGDVLGDAPAALRFERERGAPPDDPAAALRLAERAAAVPDAEHAAETTAALERAADHARAPEVAAALRVVAARRREAASPDEAQRLYRMAEAAWPGGPAAAAVEAATSGAARVDVLARQLPAAGPHERAVRFRLALAAGDASAGLRKEALRALAPLVANGDEAAVAWSIDLARALAMATGDRTPEAALLAEVLAAELAEGEAEARPDELTFERLLALGEALEALEKIEEATAAYRRAWRRAPEPRQPAASLALVRLAARRGSAEAKWDTLVDELRRLAATMAPPERDAIEDEAERLALAAGLPTRPLPHNRAADAVRVWWSAARANGGGASDGLERLAQAAGADAPGTLWGAVGVHRILEGADGKPALARAARAGGFAGVEAAVCDLVVAPLGPVLDDVRRAHAERLFARDGEAEVDVGALGEALLMEDAAAAEAEGRLRAAAQTCARVLVDRPDCLEAAEALRRLSVATGDPGHQARALAAVGRLLPSPREAAPRFAEAALVFEEAGDEDEAARLYLEVLARVPDDEEAYHRLFRVLERRRDHVGLDTLLSFRVQNAAGPAAKTSALGERARLRAERGQTAAAILDHRRVLALEPRHVGSLLALARAAREARRFEVASGYLEAAASASGGAEGLQIRLDLAAVAEESGTPAASIDILRALVDAQPSERLPRERLITLSLRLGHPERALEQLRALAGLAETPAARAVALCRIGEIERDHRNSPAEAIGAFRAALEADPLGDAAAELAALAPDTCTLSPSDEAAIDRALEALRGALRADPLDPVRLSRVRDLARVRGMKVLADVTNQLLTALGEGSERGRVRDLARLVPPARLAALTPPLAAPNAPPEAGATPRVEPEHSAALLVELAPLVAPAMARLEPVDLSARGVSRHTRVAPGSDARLRWIEAAGLSLGISEVTVHVVSGAERRVEAFDAPEPILVLGRGTVGGDPASRFRVGRALELLRRRATGLDRRDVADYVSAWHGTAHLAGAVVASAPADVKAHAKAIGRHLGRKEVKALAAYRERFEADALDVTLWREQILRAADRVGLLVAGDLAQALRASAAGAAVATVEQLRGPPFAELIAFALSDLYASLRTDAGLTDA